jgi:hypothetical protein
MVFEISYSTDNLYLQTTWVNQLYLVAGDIKKMVR